MTEDFRGLRPRRGRPRCGSPRDVVGTLDRRAHREAQRGAAQRAAEVALLVDTRRISRRTGARPPQHAAAPICSGVGACSTSWSCSRAPPVSWASVQRGPWVIYHPAEAFPGVNHNVAAQASQGGKAAFGGSPSQWQHASATACPFNTTWHRERPGNESFEIRDQINDNNTVPRPHYDPHCKISGALGD